MKKHPRLIVTLAMILASALALPRLAQAGLSGPPSSYLVPTRDGKHLLIMLSPVPIEEDAGNLGKLPTGEEVQLRETFPASGLYKIGETVPLWKVDWYGGQHVVRLSHEGRYLVRVNEFGGGYLGERPSSYWGLKFYDAGAEIKSYDVGQLVDHLSFMEFTSSDWHYLWIDDSVYHMEIEGDFYRLKTSCRETYRFNITTGEIVEEYRGWRIIKRTSLALLVALGLLGSVWFYRYITTIKQVD